MDRTSIGRRVAAIRKHRCMTQAWLADAIGVSKHVLVQVEHGCTRVTLEVAVRIAAVLRCTIYDLLAEPDAPMPRLTRSRHQPRLTATHRHQQRNAIGSRRENCW
jgi:DNA-binding XRE family transcriptional regulator